MEVYKFFRYCIIINAAFQFHWMLSNSEAGPRIWTNDKRMVQTSLMPRPYARVRERVWLHICSVIGSYCGGTHWTEHANQTGDKLKDYYS